MTLLRPARSTDAGSVGAILTEFVATTPWMPPLHTAAEDIAHAGRLIDKGWVTVAAFEGQIIGFCACDGADLDALFVAQAFRGQGVGRMLLSHLQRQHAALDLWTFQANTRAQAFYKSHGFVEIERTDGARNDERLPDVRMRWQREES